jgi:hypothetical protein
VTSPLDAARWIAARLDEDALPYAIGGALALAAWSSRPPPCAS